MKIILSRKGFDSCAGGCASPILDGTTLLSLPIPVKKEHEKNEMNIRYSNLNYNGINYAKLISDLNPKFKGKYCHLDPDIRTGIRKIKNWKPAFGQAGAAQNVLNKTKVSVGDIFLFFGWFRAVECVEERYHFRNRSDGGEYKSYADLHVIYGYMQIGEIIRSPEEIKKYKDHPHSCVRYLGMANNTLYIPSDKLTSLGLNEIDGFGTLDLSDERILTQRGCPRSFWKNNSAFKNQNTPSYVQGNKGNIEYVNYPGRWQERVFEETKEVTEWAKKVIVGK